MIPNWISELDTPQKGDHREGGNYNAGHLSGPEHPALHDLCGEGRVLTGLVCAVPSTGNDGHIYDLPWTCVCVIFGRITGSQARAFRMHGDRRICPGALWGLMGMFCGVLVQCARPADTTHGAGGEAAFGAPGGQGGGVGPAEYWLKRRRPSRARHHAGGSGRGSRG